MIGDILFFSVGFLILVKGSSILIDGASSLARLFKVSSWIIGVIIVGIGTSIPEFSINLASVFRQADIGVGTIVGSTTFNILFVLGTAAIISPLAMRPAWVKKDFAIAALAILVAAWLAFWHVAGQPFFIGITRAEGLVLFLLFLVWLWFEMRYERRRGADEAPAKVFTIFTSWLMIIIGVAGVALGGKWVVDGATTLARAFGASEALIGLTLVSAGTSIPEFFVTINAVIKKQTGLAVGNIVGSNIFNFFGIFGVVSIIKPLSFSAGFTFDMAVAFAATLLLIAYMFMGDRYILKRWHGVVFLLIYITYIIFLLNRG